MKKERRYLIDGVELRDKENQESRTLSGYAAVFDSDSCDMGFIETLDPHCLDDVIGRNDVVCLYNHTDLLGILARSVNGEGTLRLSVDSRGLLCEFEAPNTQLGNDMLESVRRGDIRGMSIAFTVKKDEWTHKGDEYRRRIMKIDRLYDVSLVVQPAYDATSIDTRGLDDLKRIEKDSHVPSSSYYERLRSEIF